MPIESYTVIDGQRINEPSGDAPPTDSAAAGAGTDAPGATDQPPAGDSQPSASPTDTPPAPAGEAGADTDDDEPLRDDSEITAARLERRFARLTAARRKAEREVEAQRQQHSIELAQTRGQLEALQRVMSGAAPALPETPPPPTGPPQAEQFERHEEFVQAAAHYAADQRIGQERQQQQQLRFQQDLMSREATFKQAHPDFDQVVRTGLAGKVSPVLQQALMLVPDGPAVAYTLAQQPDLVQRLNQMPPPLVLVELGRLSPPVQAPPSQGVRNEGGAGGNGTTPSSLTPSLPSPSLPTPPTPLPGSGGGAPTLAYNENMSSAEYAAWRKRTSALPAWKER